MAVSVSHADQTLPAVRLPLVAVSVSHVDQTLPAVRLPLVAVSMSHVDQTLQAQTDLAPNVRVCCGLQGLSTACKPVYMQAGIASACRS